ncbi:farnesol dehydrogenase-like [Neocloeon triangulifer]|uniref:farnesol dehydrogenase-like n=1 Tax=Neocloeon triangulifer TaxID=2078957 RepID=UPI00286F2113|nr:farnesol dehydrogenase-like [Neocloeon triangulifer]XP_059476996.1 farnesol dehydrogenase-like [Neocloeon triangulifer]
MERWSGRVAIVTGASAGIGAATARALAEGGMKVVGVARRAERVQNLADELKKEKVKGELHAIQGDVSLEEDVKRVIKWTRDTLGGVDVLVNNAGLAPLTLLSELDASVMKKIFETNVFGLCYFTSEALKDMKSRGVDDGHIVHVSSVAGTYIPDFSGTGPYAASKHSVKVFTEILRREMRDMKTKMRVTCICPGLVETEIFSASGFPEDAQKGLSNEPNLKAKDVADAIIFAVSAPPHVQIHDIVMHPTGEKF